MPRRVCVARQSAHAATLQGPVLANEGSFSFGIRHAL